jgi:hypothetical protein
MTNLTDYFQMNPRAMVNLGTATVAGAAATTLTLSGLDLSAYTAFKVHVKLKNPTGSTALVSLYYNADTTATNYHQQYLLGNSTTITAARSNDGIVIVMSATSKTNARIEIETDVDGIPRAFVKTNRDNGSGLILQNRVHQWTSATNITSITLSSSVASSLDIGSTFTVYGIQ